MYLRRCYRNKDGKRHGYWALVESYRSSRGPRQRGVAYLGEMDAAGRLESQQTSHARRPSAAPLPPSLESRTHLGMARQFSPVGGSLRSLDHHLRSFISYRLLHDHLTQGFETSSR